MTDLYKKKDISDPLNIRLANPELKPSFNNNISATSNTYFTETSRSFNANLSYNNTMNSTTRIVTYDENTGGQTTQPTNVNGNWRINGSLPSVLHYPTKIHSKYTHQYKLRQFCRFHCAQQRVRCS